MKTTTNKGFVTNWAEIIRKIQAEATAFQDDTPEKKRARIERAKADDKFFAETYFPHYVSEDAFPTYTEELFDAGDGIGRMARSAKSGEPNDGPFSVVAGYNESAKSTFLSHIQPMKFIVFKMRWFILFVSKTDIHAAQFVKAIKLEFDHNERLRNDFGDLSTADDWAENDLTTNTGRRVMGIGRDQSPKGLNTMGHRYDHIVIDDMEEDRMTMNPKIVKKYFKWIRVTLFPSANSKRWSGVYIFNYTSKRLIGHLLMTAPHTEHYHKVIIRALDENDESTWPSRHPTAKLLREREEDPVEFDQIRMQHPRDEDTATFKEAWIQYWTDNEIFGSRGSFGAYDPSTGKGKDFQAIVRLNVDAKNPAQRYVKEAHVNHASKYQCLRMLYRLDQEEKFTAIAIEGNAFQATLQEDFDELAKEFGYSLPIMLVTHTMSKDDRMIRFSTNVEKAKVKFGRNTSQGRLIEQLVNYPDEHDDGPDALEMANDLANRYMLGGFKPEYETVTKRGLFKGDDDED